MKKLNFTFLLTLLINMVPTKILAYDAQIDGIYYNFSETNATVTYLSIRDFESYNGFIWNKYNENAYSGDIIIPEYVTYNEIKYHVTYIDNYAFMSCSSMTSVVIPNSVTSIGTMAFYGCSSLVSITFPSNITSIGDGAFCYCNSFTSIILPQNITSVGGGAFQNCSGLTSVTIQCSPTVNLQYAPFGFCDNLKEVIFDCDVVTPLFFYVESLKKVTISKKAKTIDDYAFCFCDSLSTITIPNSVTSIGNQAFQGCGCLASIVFSDSITFIGSQAFEGTAWLNSQLDGLLYIGSVAYTFKGMMPENTSIILKDCTTCITGYAFQKCSNLTSITVPNGVIYIGEYAFEGCTGLKSISIPNSVTTIGNSAFSDCDGLKSVSLSCENIDSWFSGQKNITEVKLSNEVKNVSENAFYGCTNIKLIEMGSNITTIGMRAFAGSDKLTDVICQALLVPVTDKTAFENSYVDYATLHVPATSLNSYKETAPWSGFKNIVKIAMPEHTLTYIVDGEKYKSYQIEEGEIITPEPEPIKEGFTFSGWSEIPETMPDHDVTVTGTFSINSYVLTYLLNGEIYKQQELKFGTAITPEPAIEQEGHTFSGWSEIPATMPAHDVTITGTLTVNKYILTYILDGQEYKSLEVEYGTAITPEPDPEKEGYSFSGWIGLPETMPARLVIVTGTFNINSYTLTYMIDEEVYKQVVYEYGASITPEPAPQGDYVSFEWVGVPETMPAHDVTVTAVYETGIAEIIMMAQQGHVRIYAPNGKRLDKLQKGLNIVVMQDGTTKKAVVK